MSFHVSGINKCPKIMHNSDAGYKLQESKLVSARHILRHCSHLHGDLMICVALNAFLLASSNIYIYTTLLPSNVSYIINEFSSC